MHLYLSPPVRVMYTAGGQHILFMTYRIISRAFTIPPDNYDAGSAAVVMLNQYHHGTAPIKDNGVQSHFNDCTWTTLQRSSK